MDETIYLTPWRLLCVGGSLWLLWGKWPLMMLYLFLLALIDWRVPVEED